MTNEKFIEMGNLLMLNCNKYDEDCTTCPYKKECEEYLHTEINSMCYHCKKWFNGCAGTQNQTWTGCIYRER